MKRAMLVTAGTAAGLVSVLSYSGPGGGEVLAGVPTSVASGLGAPTAAAADPADPPAAAPVPVAVPAAATVAAATPVTPKPAAARTPKPAPTITPTPTPKPPAAEPTAPAARNPAKPTPSPTPTPKKAAPAKTPAPSPTPVASVSKDVTGSAVQYKYGTLQVAIRVKDGKVLDAWAVSYPKGESLPYSEMAIPILRSRTIAAQSAQIAAASGASLTSAAWNKSVAAALAEAGL